MKNALMITILSVALLAMTSQVSFAQGPYDLAEYLLMPPGSWRVVDQTGDGIADGGRKYDLIQGYLVERDYDKVGQGWQVVDGNIWEVDGSGASLVGFWEPGSGVEWLPDPIHLPTAMSVGDTISWTIQLGGEWNIGALAITDEGVTVPTPAGTFTDCLEIWEMELEEDAPGAWIAQIELNYYARNVGVVRRMKGEMLLGDPQTYYEFTEEVVNYHVAP
jgi:hypothetical protein